MSEKKELSQIISTAKEYTSGISATFVAAMGSALTSLVHSLQTEQFLYGNLVALGTMCFIVYRAILMGLDMWIKTQDRKHQEALKKIAAMQANLDEGNRGVGDRIGEISEELKEQNLAEAIRKNRVRLEKEVCPDLPERLKKDGDL